MLSKTQLALMGAGVKDVAFEVYNYNDVLNGPNPPSGSHTVYNDPAAARDLVAFIASSLGVKK